MVEHKIKSSSFQKSLNQEASLTQLLMVLCFHYLRFSLNFVIEALNLDHILDKTYTPLLFCQKYFLSDVGSVPPHWKVQPIESRKFSGFFCPNRKAAWNVRTTLIIYKINTKYCNLKVTYLVPTRKN